MENYSYNSSSYPDSHDSSPLSRDRDLDFDTQPQPSPWDTPDQSLSSKPKFLISYGGKIQPRPYDNQLSYVGGDTKILSVDSSIRFSSFLSKLSSLSSFQNDSSPLSFKYQLPGEDLDALISVTNDDDLEHMMLEYDRLYRSSAKPARMRLFLFPSQNNNPNNPNNNNNNNNNNNTSKNSNISNSNPNSSYGSDGGVKSERERFVEALNSAPPPAKSSPSPPPPAPENVDFLFGSEKGIPVLPQSFPPPPPSQPPVARIPDFTPESDLHARLQRLQIREQREENLVGGYAAVGGGGGGEYYVQKPTVDWNLPVSAQPTYWPEKQVIGGGGFQPPVAVTTEQQPVYMIPGPGGVFHASPMMRPVTGPAGQGYYMNRVGVTGGPHEVYREQPVFNVVPSPPVISTTAQQQQVPLAAISSAPAQMAYDSALGRQVYYHAPGGVPQHTIPTGAHPAPSKASPQGSL